jgi:hypothetical protein
MFNKNIILSAVFAFSCLSADGGDACLPVDNNVSQNKAAEYIRIKDSADKLIQATLGAASYSSIWKKFVEQFCTASVLSYGIKGEKALFKISDKNQILQELCVPLITMIITLFFLDRYVLKNKNEIYSLNLLKELIYNVPSGVNFQESELNSILTDIDFGMDKIRRNRLFMKGILAFIDSDVAIFASVCFGLFAWFCNQDCFIRNELGETEIDFGKLSFSPSLFLTMGVVPLIVVFSLFIIIDNSEDESDKLINQIKLKINEFKQQINQKETSQV